MSTLQEDQMLIARARYRAKQIAVLGWASVLFGSMMLTLIIAFSPQSNIAIIFAIFAIVAACALAGTWLNEQGKSELAHLRMKYLKSQMTG